MNLKETLKFMWLLFCSITTVAIIYSAILFGPLSEGYIVVLREYYFYRILIIAAASSLPTLILVQSEFASRKESLLRKGIHLVVTLCVTFGLLINFGWLDVVTTSIILVVFIVVYVIGQIVWRQRSNALVDQLNKRITEIRNKENVTDNS